METKTTAQLLRMLEEDFYTHLILEEMIKAFDARLVALEDVAHTGAEHEYRKVTGPGEFFTCEIQCSYGITYGDLCDHFASWMRQGRNGIEFCCDQHQNGFSGWFPIPDSVREALARVEHEASK